MDLIVNAAIRLLAILLAGRCADQCQGEPDQQQRPMQTDPVDHEWHMAMVSESASLQP
jgi:hypothetical protein